VNEYNIKAEISFHDTALDKITSWPIRKNLRLSFWLEGSAKTMFSEIQNDGTIDKVNILYEVNIVVPKVDFLEGKLLPGSLFHFGILSNPIGSGRILSVT
jgi:hypothetical protein